MAPGRGRRHGCTAPETRTPTAAQIFENSCGGYPGARGSFTGLCVRRILNTSDGQETMNRVARCGTDVGLKALDLKTDLSLLERLKPGR